MADNYGAPPQRGPAHERMGIFVGGWHAEGESYGGPQQDRKNPKAHAERWVGDEVTEWHPGQFFVVQREDAKVGSGSLITHAVLGYDGTAGHYISHAFENHGHYRRYIVRSEGNVWTFSGDTERCRIEFSEDGNRQSVSWEWRPVDDEWLPLCDRVNVRVR